MLLVFIVFKKTNKSKKPKQKQTKINNPINIINKCIDCVLYKCIHLINKPDRKKNIICLEITEFLYK